MTSDTLIGKMLGQRPSTVLGGKSWQTISDSGKQTENVVYWDVPFSDLGLRMVGIADLEPLASSEKKGYNLFIRGLEFRVGRKNVIPEREGQVGRKPTDTAVLRPLFIADDDKTFSNGAGTLEVIYNDGIIRVTEDTMQKNFYVHAVEPYGDAILSSIQNDLSVPEKTAQKSELLLGPWLEKKIGKSGMQAMGLACLTPYVLFFLKGAGLLNFDS